MLKAAIVSTIATLLALAIPASVVADDILTLVVPVELSGIDQTYTGAELVCYLLPMSPSEALANPTAAAAKRLLTYPNSVGLTRGATYPNSAMRFGWHGTALASAKSVLCEITGFDSPSGLVKFSDAKIDKTSRFNPVVVAPMPGT